MNWIYWICVLIGFVGVLLFLWLQWRDVNHKTASVTENFYAGGTTEGGVVQVTEEDTIVPIPQKSHIRFYLSSFLEPSTYQCAANQWCDGANVDQKFFIMSSTEIPATLTPENGLPIKGVILKGAPSYSLAATGTSYELGSFTYVFYGRIKSLDFSVQDKISLLDLSAQTPGRVRLYIQKNVTDDTKVKVCAILGSDCGTTNYQYEWSYDINAFIGTSASVNTLYALSYNKDTKRIGFQVGTNMTLYADISVMPITLSVSPVQLNKDGALDANMVATLFYDIALSQDELTSLEAHLMQHSSGYVATLRARTLLESQLLDATKQTEINQSTIDELLAKLGQCVLPSAVAPAEPQQNPADRWKISMGNASISSADLGKCSPLSIHSFGNVATNMAAATHATVENPVPSTGPAKVQMGVNQSIVGTALPDTSIRNPTTAKPVPASSTSTNSTSTNTTSAGAATATNRYRIPYPTNVSSSTTSKDPFATSVATTSTSTTASVAPAAPPVPAKDDGTFWTNFFGFLKTQDEKTETSAASVGLPTQPVQDAPKIPEATTTTTNNELSFWEALRKMFTA